MWPFNNVPRAEIKKKYGFDVTDEWLRKVQLASVRFNNGGSGSFVSSNGLVLTNYHIVEDIVGELSTPQKDYAKDGFVAQTLADEKKIDGLELNELISIEDVTKRVSDAVKPGMSDADAFGARRKEMTSIESESSKATGLRSDVITLYQGGQYHLYRFKQYTDVRLVFAPEQQAAFVGRAVPLRQRRHLVHHVIERGGEVIELFGDGVGGLRDIQRDRSVGATRPRDGGPRRQRARVAC